MQVTDKNNPLRQNSESILTHMIWQTEGDLHTLTTVYPAAVCSPAIHHGQCYSQAVYIKLNVYGTATK